MVFPLFFHLFLCTPHRRLLVLLSVVCPSALGFHARRASTRRARIMGGGGGGWEFFLGDSLSQNPHTPRIHIFFIPLRIPLRIHIYPSKNPYFKNPQKSLRESTFIPPRIPLQESPPRIHKNPQESPFQESVIYPRIRYSLHPPVLYY